MTVTVAVLVLVPVLTPLRSVAESPSGHWSDGWWTLGPGWDGAARQLPVWFQFRARLRCSCGISVCICLVGRWGADTRPAEQARGQMGPGMGGRCGVFRRFLTSCWSSSHRVSAVISPGLIMICSITLYEACIISFISLICSINWAF